jgi:predicted small lipoprotein YifL
MRAFPQAVEHMKPLLLILLCSCALAGCGQKGPLVQPPPAGQETQGN